MPQLTDAITSEELGGAPFVILRSFFRQEGGEKALVHEDTYETFGTVHPAPPKELELLPEEYRSQQVLLIHSPVQLSLGLRLSATEFSTPDRILFHHQMYLVISVRDWSAFGFFRALAVLQKEPSL